MGSGSDPTWTIFIVTIDPKTQRHAGAKVQTPLSLLVIIGWGCWVGRNGVNEFLALVFKWRGVGTEEHKH